MNNLTAIEKLIQTIEFWNITIDCPNLFKAICEQALELEKQQIIDAVDYTYNNIDQHSTGELYYNKTFKK